jgi:tetratricopeptide (TPR) repeat protein
MTAPLAEGVASPADPPDRIGPYRIVRELGRGGMGRVYLAEQMGQDFRRPVALKVMDAAVAGQVLERRFRDERRILAGLEHPGIARFYDAGRTLDGRGFLALEYVEGPDLLEHARQRDLSTEERIHLFLEVLDAVQFAHARSIVHRDLKPANILVGADGRPRLLDFGIAKLIDPDADAAGTRTRTEYPALTPAYASPEQFRGDRVTAASDVFSLGVVLYELLAGVRPFGAKGSSRAALERAVIGEDPDPPSAASRRAVTMSGAARTVPAFPPYGRRARLGRDLDAICLKALCKEPGARYASAAEFARDVHGYLEGRPVRARAGRRRYRLATAAALASAAAIMAVTAVHGTEPPSPPPAPRAFPLPGVSWVSVAELERRFAAAPASVEAGAALAIGLSDDRRSKEAQALLSRLREIPGRQQDPLIDYAEAKVAVDLDESQRALVLFTRARDGALAGGRGEVVGAARAERGRLLTKMGDHEAARAETELAREHFERAGDRAWLISVLNDLAVEYVRQGWMDKGEVVLEEALAEARAGGQSGDVMLLNLARLARLRGRPDLAEPKQRDVLERRQRSGDYRGAVLHELAETLHDLGRGREVDPLLDESIERRRKAGLHSILAEELFTRGLVDLGRARLERVARTVDEIEAAAQAAGAKANLGLAYHLRGREATARGDFAAARRHLAEASRLLVDSGDVDRASDVYLAWAAAERAAGNPAAALPLLDAAQARLADRGSAHPVGFFSGALRARIDAEAGRTAEARRRLDAMGGDPSRSPSVSRRLAFLASRAALARAERRFDDARRDLDAARSIADGAGRMLDSLEVRLDRAELELAAGARGAALSAAAEVRREALPRRLGAVVARALRCRLSHPGLRSPG